MSKRLRRAGLWCVAAMVAVVASCAAGPVACAQGVAGIAGNWQGTLDVGKGQRIVLQVSRASDEQHAEWRGLMYLLDSEMAYEGHTTTAMSVEGAVVRFAVAPIDVRFEGKLSATGASMVGTWTQGSAPAHALTLTRVGGDAAWAIPKGDAPMATGADPGWEVVTVKPTDPDDRNNTFDVHGRHVVIEGETVEIMLVVAYGVQKNQIEGAPGWVRTERFTVDGVPDVDGKPNVPQVQSMLKKLLADRFGMKLHHDQRDMPVFALTIAKGEKKIGPSAGDPNGLPRQECNGGILRSCQFTNASMSDLALLLLMEVDRPVVNQTGLSGRYDFQLKWSKDEGSTPEANAVPGLFTAIQEQVGLKLQPVRAPADVLVIDKIEQPTGN